MLETGNQPDIRHLDAEELEAGLEEILRSPSAEGSVQLIARRPAEGEREVREETGLDVEPLEFLGVWMDRYGGDSTAEATLNFYWTARVRGGEAAPADDVDDLRWFARDELPPADELAFDNVPLVLRAWQEHAERAALDR